MRILENDVTFHKSHTQKNAGSIFSNLNKFQDFFSLSLFSRLVEQ